MSKLGPLYLGFDLSTQQLKGIAISPDLKVAYEARVDFDQDFSAKYGVEKGVLSNKEEQEVFAPVAMWLEALDLVLRRLQERGIDFGRVKGIAGAGMQHGSVYWSTEAEGLLSKLDGNRSLIEQLAPKAFSHANSPNWQDASTQKECDEFDECLGSQEKLAQITGSKAHHRFTGGQILRFRRHHPNDYWLTSRISLVSSFLCSLFVGKIAPFDISDLCGMNLWDIKRGDWHDELLALTAGPEDVGHLKKKLGNVPRDGGESIGTISRYYIDKYDFDPSCTIIPFTGDNPSTILALPLRPLDAMVSLGTSTTFLMSTPHYKSDPSYHFFNHPTTTGLFMFMLCYKNGGLAREQVRDSINKLSSSSNTSSSEWTKFNEIAAQTPPMGQDRQTSPMKMGLYFPKPEIVPNVRAGEWRFLHNPDSKSLIETNQGWNLPEADARAIVESQLLSLRLRSQNLMESPGSDMPPQPRRIYLVGGGSQNATIAKITGEVLGSVEGVFKLDVGENACALGAAHKAVWAIERKPGESFEDLIGNRWSEKEHIEKIADGYQKQPFETYGKATEGFDMMEKQILRQEQASSSA
ncbi:MAG: hypothetical protein M1835_005294 [Candelina submexicana]|nr:MAG: hypothetical protein M1835_005294 [Candelina submexicana]